jgi:hypothetical protein
MKKMFAMIAAATMLCGSFSAMSALPTSAKEFNFSYMDWTFEETVKGSVIAYTTPELFSGLIVETDGTTLTEEMLGKFEEVREVLTYEKYIEDGYYHKRIFNVNPENTAFVLTINDASTELLTTLGRELSMEFDCIKNVHLAELSERVHVSPFNMFHVVLKDDATELNDTLIPEFTGYIIDASVNPIMVVANYQLNNEMNEKYTSYELLCYYTEKGKELEEKYPDIFLHVKPCFAIPDSDSQEFGISTDSVWTSAGDSNSDGAVDASDAANVLNIAAQNGTGANIKATAADDVNADGAVNATDAAAVLCYAAAKGTGADVSWVDILRR